MIIIEQDTFELMPRHSQAYPLREGCRAQLFDTTSSLIKILEKNLQILRVFMVKDVHWEF